MSFLRALIDLPPGVVIAVTHEGLLKVFSSLIAQDQGHIRLGYDYGHTIIASITNSALTSSEAFLDALFERSTPST
ncbi:hypothetical protein BHK69_30875 (plasmid) [Bosea vaviloviae]|uniref:Phosphoglycerate mutase n=1 Tax=Bosea vaviloviae TaxID=1526658 RepID=A0A1D7UCJ7_9HYPH|nr:hypothetical protein BHK69_30875 [Bosea vaviloviae]